MKIEELDKNFKSQEAERSSDIAFYGIPDKNFDLYGVYYDSDGKIFRRFPEEVAEKMIDGKNAKILAKHTSGGRLRFATDSSTIIIKATWQGLSMMQHMTLAGSSGFTLCEKSGKKEKYVSTVIPGLDCDRGVKKEIRVVGGKMKNYVLYFPLYNGVDSLEIGLDKKAKIACGRKYKDKEPILFYGSSITQGGCASRPDNMYPALISKWNNVDFIDLGISGHAKAEEGIIEYLSGIKCSVFVYDYDHNADDAEYLSKTHYKLYEEFRKTHKDIPIIMVSSPNPERIDKDGKRVEVIRQSYLKAKESGDNNVYFIDGKTLFGKKDRGNCTIDGSHPTDLGFYRMATVINKVVKKFL
ncbi:MAG: hypothetical protein IJS67_02300 [Clostridia bacterium]|nr:hypothetical protein [Clostridia bacterium]